MEAIEESEIIRRMRDLALERGHWAETASAARAERDFGRADEAEGKARQTSHRLDGFFEEFYRRHHPKLARIARHLARRDEDAQDIEQLAWTRYQGLLARVDPEYPGFPLLATCLRTTAIDYYRVAGNAAKPVGDESHPEIASRAIPPACDDYETYSALLELALGREGGPAHERVAFGLSRLIEIPPRLFVRDYSEKTLQLAATYLRNEYRLESGLPEPCLDAAFRELQIDFGRRLDEADRATAQKYTGTPLPSRKIGDGRFREYYGGRQPEPTVTRWTENVLRRLRKAPAGKTHGYRKTERGHA